MAKIEKRKPVFPTLESVKKAIDLVLSKDFSEFQLKDDPNAYFKELDKYFLATLQLLPYGFLQVSGDKMIPKCYRLRKNDQNCNTTFISEFSHPPPYLTKLRRANLPKHPVFYASPDIKTSIIETLHENHNKASEGEYFISEWAFRQDEIFYLTPFLYGNTSKKNIFRQLGDSALGRFESQFPELTKENIEVLSTILTFLANQFVYESTHIVSSYIAHSYLYAPHQYRADVFIYPSVKANRHTVNFAIHPNTVVQKMVLEKIYCLSIKDFEILEKSEEGMEYKMTTNLLNRAINDHGIIKWYDADNAIFQEFKEKFEHASKTENDL